MTPAEKGLQLMTEMGATISGNMVSPTMPSDYSIITTLSEVAKTVDDYTEKAANAVKEMAEALLDAVKEAINKAITKDPKEIPTPLEITSAIKDAIQKAAPI